MTQRDKFEEKGTGEKWPLVFDFTPNLLTGETLQGTITVTCVVNDGVDASPSAVLAGGNVFDATSKMVIVPVQGGVAGVDYDILVHVATTNPSKTLELSGILPVRQK